MFVKHKNIHLRKVIGFSSTINQSYWKYFRQLQNDHLVQLYGVCEKPNLLIVTEYMEEGALLDYLKKNKSRLLTQTTSCLDIVKQVIAVTMSCAM